MKSTNRKFSLRFLIALMVTILAGIHHPLLAKPNIIWIMADDLGYGDLGSFGQKEIKTPELDKMAKTGMRLTQFYAGSTVCAPSRCVLMTGKHTGHAYIRGNKEVKPMGQWPLPDETLTVAELVKKSGYRTGLIGKWGLGGPGTIGHPNKQGFDYFYGYLCQRHAHNFYPEFLFKNDEKVFLEGNVVENERTDGAGFATGRVHYSHDLFAQEAIDFVDRNKNKPFFLYYSITIPHANNEAGRKGMEVPDLGEYANKDWPEPQKGHAAMISRMDSDIGKLLSKLKSEGIAEKTLVLFTSDNGPHREGGNNPDFNNSNGPLKGMKRHLYEGGIRVPTIAWWPGTIQPGSSSRHIAYFGDLMATAGQLAGQSIPKDLDSISFLPTLTKNGKQKRHPFLYWEFYAGSHRQAVRQGKWKAIRFQSGDVHLFDLNMDLGEEKNLASIYPNKVKKMVSIMDSQHTPSEFWTLTINK